MVLIEKTLVFLATCTLCLSACAESPSPVVPVPDGGGQDLDGKSRKKIPSLKFTGKWVNDTPRPQPDRNCDLYLSVDEDEHGESGDHGHGLLFKLDFKTADGHSPSAGISEFFLFDSTALKYYELSSNAPNTAAVLTQTSIYEEDLDGDRKAVPGAATELQKYETDGILKQSIRVDFEDGFDRTKFSQALEEVVEGEVSLADAEADLNLVKKIEMILDHNGHPHYPKCDSFELSAVEETDFDVDDHDH